MVHLKNTLNELGSDRNWIGAYAELVTFDFLNSDSDWLSQPITLSQTVPACETLGDDRGMTNVNFDGYYDDFGVCFDVKVLKNKSGEILGNIIKAAKSRLGISDASIYPNYPGDMDFQEFESRIGPLRDELVGLINVQAKTRYARSIIMPALSYRIMWASDRGVTIGPSEYDPYQHAGNHHTLVFKYAKKFSKVSPSLIVLVVFPWYSESFLAHDICNEVFYRAFCRRFFCQYSKDIRKAKEVIGDFESDITMADVTNKLSGILILADNSITAEPQADQIKSFAYLNPNAVHKVSGHFRDHLSTLGVRVDDFAHDNY